MTYKLIGKDFTPPDVRAKLTGEAKFSEDYRADGMLFCKLLRSPMPHAKVRHIDTSKALKMDGVIAVLTADDVPSFPAPQNPILTNEPHYVGDAILAVAAVSEALAVEAIEAIEVDLEQLPFTTDPLDSLYPGGANARVKGNVNSAKNTVEMVKWTAADFVDSDKGVLPQGKPSEEWSYGDLDAGFAKAKTVIDESFVTASVSHQCLETRSAMAYWQNGRCFLHGSVQSQAFSFPGLVKYLGIKPADLVFISEYCGGGFGSKGSAYPLMVIPAYMAKKTNRPVMMRVTRDEEYAFAGRPGFQGHAKIGFAADGRITALDLYIVQENGANQGFPDLTSAADTVSTLYQPGAMRWQGVSVFTNTPLRTAQRGPGTNEIVLAIEPLIDKGARSLGLDRTAVRRLNAPDNAGKHGAKQNGLSSAYMKEALDKGAKLFGWADKVKQSGQRTGNKVIGIGVGQGHHPSGYSGFDGLIKIAPDGKLHIHTGVGNLGTYSFASTSRVAAEVLGYDWSRCVIIRGDSDRHLPWNFGQFSSNTSYTETRTNHAAAMDAKTKLLEIAATDLGGAPADYELKNETVVAKADASRSISFADAAKRAIALGGKYSGKTVPGDLNSMTKASVEALAGSGLIGVAKDTLPLDKTVPALAVGFVKIQLDVETGDIDILDYVGVADCGTVMHPRGLEIQTISGAAQGFSMARFEHIVYDSKLGLPANVQLYQSKPLSYLDMPLNVELGNVGIADPTNPLGVKGVGEPVEGCAGAALICAISDALGGHYFNRTPVVRDYIINALAKRPQSYKPLEVNTF